MIFVITKLLFVKAPALFVIMPGLFVIASNVQGGSYFEFHKAGR